MVIYLVRHAQADHSTGEPYQSLPGPPLSEAGIEQATATARLLAPSGIERVVSSPMRRCTQTARPLCAALGLELHTDDDLGEMQPAETPAELGLRVLRATFQQRHLSSVALVSHSAPLEQLILALTRGRHVFDHADHRGARIGVAAVWQLICRDGTWRAQHIPAGGVRA